jgi:hypothetical protein
MSTKNTAGKAAGQAAALPNADLLRSVATLAREIDGLHSNLKHEVFPLLRALENLIDCHRVLSGIKTAADHDRVLDDRLVDAVDGWRNPMQWEELDVLHNLARLTVNAFVPRQFEAETLVSHAYALANQTEGAA